MSLPVMVTTFPSNGSGLSNKSTIVTTMNCYGQIIKAWPREILAKSLLATNTARHRWSLEHQELGRQPCQPLAQKGGRPHVKHKMRRLTVVLDGLVLAKLLHGRAPDKWMMARPEATVQHGSVMLSGADCVEDVPGSAAPDSRKRRGRTGWRRESVLEFCTGGAPVRASATHV
jgi:hypothetical protein